MIAAVGIYQTIQIIIIPPEGLLETTPGKGAIKRLEMAIG
jgi:hypothetical protein